MARFRIAMSTIMGIIIFIMGAGVGTITAAIAGTATSRGALITYAIAAAALTLMMPAGLRRAAAAIIIVGIAAGATIQALGAPFSAITALIGMGGAGYVAYALRHR